MAVPQIACWIKIETDSYLGISPLLALLASFGFILLNTRSLLLGWNANINQSS